MIAGMGSRPLTFIASYHLEAAGNTPGAVIVAEPCGCGARFVTFRTCHTAPVGAVVAVTHAAAVEHLAHSPGQPCEHVNEMAAHAAALVYRQ
jgi:hypothetical protein